MLRLWWPNGGDVAVHNFARHGSWLGRTVPDLRLPLAPRLYGGSVGEPFLSLEFTGWPCRVPDRPPRSRCQDLAPSVHLAFTDRGWAAPVGVSRLTS